MNETLSQFVRRFRLRNWLIAGVLTAAVFPERAFGHVSAPLPAKLPAEPEKLKLVADGTVTLDDINAPYVARRHDDGQFVYMASFMRQRNAERIQHATRQATGKLALVQSLTEYGRRTAQRGCAHSIHSPNNQFGGGEPAYTTSRSSCMAATQETGKLSMLDVLAR